MALSGLWIKVIVLFLKWIAIFLIIQTISINYIAPVKPVAPFIKTVSPCCRPALNRNAIAEPATALGKAAAVTLSANGNKIAEGQVPKTIPATISIQEGLDIGEDVGSPVDFTYKPPFKFTGKIEKVTFDLK